MSNFRFKTKNLCDFSLRINMTLTDEELEAVVPCNLFIVETQDNKETTLYYRVIDGNDYESMVFPIWSDEKQLDVNWCPGERVDNNTWKVDIEREQYVDPNNIMIHVYATDTLGTQKLLEGVNYNLGDMQ